MTWWIAAISIALGLATNELFQLIPWLSGRVLAFAARIDARCADERPLLIAEWRDRMERLPSNSVKLGFAIQIFFGVAIARQVSMIDTRIRGWAILVRHRLQVRSQATSAGAAETDVDTAIVGPLSGKNNKAIAAAQTSPHMDHSLSKIIELRESGFQFLHLRDDEGKLDRIMAFKQRQGFIDSILFWSETEARAGRLPAVRDSTRPAQAVWIYEGPLTEAVDRLLDLPHPGSRNESSLMKATASDLALITTLPFKLKLPPGYIA